VNDQSVRSLPVREETELDSAGERWRACSAVAKPRVPIGRRTLRGMQSRFDPPVGNVPWRGGAFAGGWRRNGGKAEGVNQGDLSAQEPDGWSLGRHPSTTATERAGVRAPIVATKGRNGPGAKGAQEGGDVTDRAQEQPPATVSQATQQAGEAQNPGALRARWAWVEPEVWTERMLTTLEEGVKGGKWFRLIDKVYALPNLRKAFARVEANGGAAGVDHVTVEEFGRHLEANLEELSQSLHDAGYYTAIVGKWHLGHADPKYWPRQRGFDYQYGPLIGEIDY